SRRRSRPRPPDARAPSYTGRAALVACGAGLRPGGRRSRRPRRHAQESQGHRHGPDRLSRKLAAFSYLNKRQQPIGYSIDLCREIVEDISTELDGMEIKIAFAPVTSANRLQKVASGEVDLECGSTTANVQRRQEVAFSPIFFVAGTKLMVPTSSSISSYPDLARHAPVVTAATTNHAAVRAPSATQK